MKKLLILFFILTFISSQKLTFQTTMLNNLLKPNENICICPISIYQVVSLVSNGASGKTYEEIVKSLIPDTEIKKNTALLLNINNQDILRYYNSKSDIVKIVNGVLTKHPVSRSFLHISKKYNALIELLESVKQVNNWVKENTNGKIEKILDENRSLGNVQMILLNAIYFKSNWKYKFDSKKTNLLPFKNLNNENKNIETMYQEFEKVMYYEDEKIKMIELPYNDNLSMIILLPSEKYNSVIDYIKKEKEDYTLIHNKLKETKNVKLYLPKFKIEYSSSLKESFKKMGMKLAFSTNANLKKLFSDSNLSKNIFIEDILHKTYIKIDEEGTEAASASAVIISKRGGGIEMRVNHSFLYMIKDKRIMDINGNNMMLFIGVINNLQ